MYEHRGLAHTVHLDKRDMITLIVWSTNVNVIYIGIIMRVMSTAVDILRNYFQGIKKNSDHPLTS